MVKQNPTKGQLLSLVSTIRREMQSHDVPAKKHTKLGYKVTESSFQKNLKGVPGGRGKGSLMKMAEAADTGTVVAGSSTLKRLSNSAKNCNTTKGNYIL